MKTIEVVCAYKECGKTFNKPLNHYNQSVKKGAKHFCTLKCAGLSTTNKLDIIGKTFGELTCIKELPKPTKKYLACYYLFKCSCGNEHKAAGSDVTTGRVKYCKECNKINRSGENSTFWKGYGQIHGGWWYRHIIKGANNRGIEVKIDIKYGWDLFLKQEKYCKLTGLLLEFPIIGAGIGTASLDRIDSNKGYIKGNVQWVHKDINIMKNNKTDEEFIRLCNLVSKHNKKLQIVEKSLS